MGAQFQRGKIFERNVRKGLKLQYFWAIVFCSPMLLTGCGKTLFNSFSVKNSKTSERSSSPTENESGAEPASNPNPGSYPDPGSNADQNPTPTNQNSVVGSGTDISGGGSRQPDFNECGGRFTGGKILIIDLKSGWFSGDGGTFFSSSIAHNCPDKPTINLDYFHITNVIVESNRDIAKESPTSKFVLPCLGKKANKSWENINGSPETSCKFESFENYGQIWVLSGDESDELDVSLSSPLFKSLIERLKERSANLSQKPLGLFLGAGLSNITHANEVASSLLEISEPAFLRHATLTPGTFPTDLLPLFFARQPLLPKTSEQLKAGEFDHDFFPLKGLRSIHDYGDLKPWEALPEALRESREEPITVVAQQPECFGDRLNTKILKPRALDRCGNTVMGNFEKPGLKVFADSNMARFYGLENPREHITRIAQYLNDAKQ